MCALNAKTYMFKQHVFTSMREKRIKWQLNFKNKSEPKEQKYSQSEKMKQENYNSKMC